MPMNRKDYPKDWPAISLRIRERAGWRCEWCGVKNGAVGARDRNGNWHDEDAIHHMHSDHGEALFGRYFPRMVRIILTVAHLGTPKPDGSRGNKHDKLDCRDENLAALCQRCHLNYDRADHLAVQAKNRRARQRERIREEAARVGQYFLLRET